MRSYYLVVITVVSLSATHCRSSKKSGGGTTSLPQTPPQTNVVRPTNPQLQPQIVPQAPVSTLPDLVCTDGSLLSKTKKLEIFSPSSTARITDNESRVIDFRMQPGPQGRVSFFNVVLGSDTQSFDLIDPRTQQNGQNPTTSGRLYIEGPSTSSLDKRRAIIPYKLNNLFNARDVNVAGFYDCSTQGGSTGSSLSNWFRNLFNG